MSQYIQVEPFFTCLDEVNYLPLTVYSMSMNVTHLRARFQHHIMLVHENTLASIVWSDNLDIWQARLNITAEPFTTMVYRRLLDNLDRTRALPSSRLPRTLQAHAPHGMGYNPTLRCATTLSTRTAHHRVTTT